MIEPKRFHLHLVRLDPETNEIKKRARQPIKPSDPTNPLTMKEDIAKQLLKFRNKGWTYWYLALEIADDNGKPRYRTVVGKTLF